MALAADVKKNVIQKYRTHKTDAGSPEVQVAILSVRIKQLDDHFKANQKDSSFPAWIAFDGRSPAPVVEVSEEP